MNSGSERKLSLPLLLTFILGFSHFSTYDFLLSVLFHNRLKFILMPHDPCLPIDATGRKNGRGAYLCPSMDCFKKAVKGKGLERSFKMAIPKEVYESLEKEMEQLDQ